MVALGQSAAVRHRAEEATLPFAGSLAAKAQVIPLPLLDLPRRDSSHDALVRAIEAAVLPRLVLAHADRPDPAESGGDAAIGPTAEEVQGLFLLLVADDRAGAEAKIAELRQRGLSLERIFLDLLAPAARRLGAAWEEDRCDFSTVTIGLMRLQHMVRDHIPEFVPPIRDTAGARRILLANPPGEQHTFGRDMLAGFFRKAGWAVRDPAPHGRREFAEAVRREAFEVIGLSAGSSGRLDAIADCIRTVRRSALNAHAGIMVGGPLFIAHPEYVALVGADATAADGRQAVLQADRLVALLARRD